MANLTFNNITADSFAADTQQGAGRRRPRHREALSCSQCRERKVRCDRKQPCKQCQTRGCSNSCSYGTPRDVPNNTINGNGTVQAGNQPNPHHRKSQTEPSSPSSSASADEDVRQRLHRLELLVAANPAMSNHHSTMTSHDESKYSRNMLSSTSSNATVIARNALQRSRGPYLSSKTRFIGGTHWLAACNNMAVLKAMLNKSSEFENSRRSFAEIKAWTQTINPVSITYSLPYTDTAGLFNQLPPRDTSEAWLRVYIQTYRHIYDIVDELTIDTITEKVWNSPAIHIEPVELCIVILLVAIGMQTEESDRLVGRSMARHVEQFAFASGTLNRPCIGSMTALLLLTLLKTIACSDTESLDSLSGIMGSTSQIAMTMGLHRDPSAFGTITHYQAEVRKRLWSIYFRLNLEYCMRVGVPMTLQPGDADGGYPANVNLMDLAADSSLEPEGKELPIQTDATFSIIAARLASIAAPYQKDICSARSCLLLESIKQVQDEFHNLLIEAPMYMRPGTPTASVAEEIQQSFLTISMHSTLLTLALHFVINAATDSIQKQHLHTVWEHSLSVLESFKQLSQKSRHMRTLAYQLLWSDTCRAAFSAGMVLNRLHVLESRSIMVTRLQHTLVLFQDTLVKHLAFMSRFWLRNAHLGPMASKNCLLLAVVVPVTARLLSEGNDVSEKELLQLGAQSVEQTVEYMKVAMKQRHQFPLSPTPSMSSTRATRGIGEVGRSISSPNISEKWSTTGNIMAYTHQPTSMMMDSFHNVFGQSYGGSDHTAVGWTPDMQWSMDSFEYTATSGSMSPISHVPSRTTTSSNYVDGLTSPPIADWTGTEHWDDVGMNY